MLRSAKNSRRPVSVLLSRATFPPPLAGEGREGALYSFPPPLAGEGREGALYSFPPPLAGEGRVGGVASMRRAAAMTFSAAFSRAWYCARRAAIAAGVRSPPG